MNSSAQILGSLWVVLLVVVVIGFPILIIVAIHNGKKKGDARRAAGQDIGSKLRRQNEATKELVRNVNNDSADQLRKMKSLLDEGLITQQEFDTKKKQILGI